MQTLIFKSCMAVLIFDKVDFRVKQITANKRRH